MKRPTPRAAAVRKRAGVPVHVAFIMDGNGRWAVERGLPRIAGHREGIKAVRRTVRAADRMGIRFVTLYCFSTENWKRPASEVAFLLKLMERQLEAEALVLHKENVRVRFLGRREDLDDGFRATMRRVESLTGRNTGLTLNFAINYGGRREIVEAVRRIVASGAAPEDVSEELIARHLDTAGMPDPDIVVRTAGEQRLSNFLVWQASYAEYYFTPVLWPDFGPAGLKKAVAAFAARTRKFGGLAGS